MIEEYPTFAKHGVDLFRPVKNNRTGTLEKHLDPDSIYRNIIKQYIRILTVEGESFSIDVRYSIRSTREGDRLAQN